MLVFDPGGNSWFHNNCDLFEFTDVELLKIGSDFCIGPSFQSLLNGEKGQFEVIFTESDLIEEGFSEMTKGCVRLFLNFGKAVSMGKRSLERKAKGVIDALAEAAFRAFIEFEMVVKDYNEIHNVLLKGVIGSKSFLYSLNQCKSVIWLMIRSRSIFFNHRSFQFHFGGDSSPTYNGLSIAIIENMKEEYGVFVRPCSVILAKYFYHQRLSIAGANVVELGVGTSLSGLVAFAKLAAHVTWKGCRTEVLANMEGVCDLNNASCDVKGLP